MRAKQTLRVGIENGGVRSGGRVVLDKSKGCDFGAGGYNAGIMGHVVRLAAGRAAGSKTGEVYG